MVANFMADNEKRSKGLISEIEVSRRKTATSYRKELIQLAYLPAAENTAPSSSDSELMLPNKMQHQRVEGRNWKRERKQNQRMTVENLVCRSSGYTLPSSVHYRSERTPNLLR